MEKLYKYVDVRISIPDKADAETVIRTLGQYYKIDRTAEPVEGDPLLLMIVEIERPKEENKIELVDVGFDITKDKITEIVDKIL